MIKEKILPMINDKVFKGVLVSKEARSYLVSLISDITGIEKKILKENIVFKNNEQQINGISEKKKITDLVVEVKANVINLEMNKDYYNGLLDKNYGYITKIKDTLIKEGEDYLDVPRVIQINFDNYNLYKPDERMIIKFEMIDKERLVEEGIGIESYHVILPNVKEKYYNEERKDALVKELMIMMVDDDKELKKLIEDNMELRKVGEKIVEISNEEEANGWYDEEEHQRKVRNTMVKSALREGWYKGKEEGRKAGIKEGIKEGKEKGIKEGKEEGKKEGIKKTQIEIVKNMILNKFDKEVISNIIGLSINEIDNIINS